ncbi:MAG: hypothetical protein J0I98_11565 [Mesorhizobium sp.]|nr:hypothetical protein [Mesorhizobium sp.]MBN9243422.1 hypothetical protein [Mesorhizobium sp.]
MSRFLSAIRRVSDNDLVLDVVSFVVMVVFLTVAFGYLTELSNAVSAWRLRQ